MNCLFTGDLQSVTGKWVRPDMKTSFCLLALYMLIEFPVCAQDYHAVQGSSTAGSLQVANNPASITNIPDAWDVVPLALQVKNTTNAFTILRYSYLSSAQTSQYRINGGNFSRYIDNNFNIRLLNARFALGRQQAIAFGLNMRGYTAVQTGRYNFRDTVKNLRSFFLINETNRILHGQARQSSWVEAFGTYSKTLWDHELDRLNAGITLRWMTGVAGAFASLENAGLQRTVRNNRISYTINSGTGTYGYSANLDEWKKENAASQNIQNLLSSAQRNLAFDLGVEYIIKPQGMPTFDEEDTYYAYTWKLGFSLLDIGRNRYTYGSQSRRVSQFKSNISDSLLFKKTAPVRTLRAFNDSISTIVNEFMPLTGTFFINNPTRLVINVDRSLSQHVFINAEVSLNLSKLAAHDAPYVNEMNLFSVTPRWESRHFGGYLPVLYNTHQQLWVGAALRAGPLLLGVHNLSSLFAQNKTQNGGGYLAFIIRPGNKTREARDKRADCPRL
ncbi:MAG: hypothetical protein INR73_14870 [Williamsia sp.]|nr:hypothetical protein [Williamsia sp.]